jgi:uncharacterized delta-60 repeat protein
MRFTAGGHSDPTFDGDGKVVVSIPGKELGAGAITIQGDKIVVAGPIDAPGQADSEDIFVARFLANGQPDPTFGGGDGRVIDDLFGGDDGFQDMAVGSDGKVVVASMTELNGNLRAAVARFTAAGKPDTSFSGDGKFVLSQSTQPFLEAITVLPSLEVVAGGQGQTGATKDFVLYGISQNGGLDQGFGTFGVASTDFANNGDVLDVLAVDPRGRILAGGQAFDSVDEFALARYTKTGQLDTTFSHDGKVTLAVDDFARVFAITFEGRKIVAGGRSNVGDDERWAVARFGNRGGLDSGFGSGGVAIHNFSTDINKGEENEGLTFDPANTRIVACGYSGNRVALVGFVG